MENPCSKFCLLRQPASFFLRMDPKNGNGRTPKDAAVAERLPEWFRRVSSAYGSARFTLLAPFVLAIRPIRR